MYDYLLCDCDGALVVSEVIAHRVLVEMLTAAFPEIDATSASRSAWYPETPTAFAGIERHFGIRLPPDFAARLSSNLERALEHSRAPIAAVRDALGRVPLPAAAISNQRRANLAAAIARAGLARVFEQRLFSAEHVARPKPYPDLYESAARQLGTEPARCIAVSDNVAGLAAARDAGMTTIAFVGASRSPGGYAQVLRHLGVRHIIERMEELPGLLAGAVAASRGDSGLRPLRQ
ncbi:HAD family hydrolase [Trinickia symbiotica]|uniref:HAD family hydrolase n=1 Tax=Trinickia symbiotica TaxID=863227 RepID=A0A2T3XQC1_9BURK|nr:HAD-IA family hydrolase [Trinickia symbiotica]PTB18698.1 HAD family hydrolase [Trinickia symbiotica]